VAAICRLAGSHNVGNAYNLHAGSQIAVNDRNMQPIMWSMTTICTLPFPRATGTGHAISRLGSAGEVPPGPWA
jgi:hypothetical protein